VGERISGPSRFVVGACRLLQRGFFRSVEAVGLENLPASGPLVVVANHVNSLVDPLLLIGCLPRAPRLLAKSTLWQKPFTRTLVTLAGAIPVVRRIDAGEDPARNLESLARCRAALAEGHVVGLFPEGISHSEPHLQELRTGAARIVLESEAEHGPLGVRIVPVGLAFDDRERFRSRVVLRVGAPLDPTAEAVRHASDRAGAVRALTARIGEVLAAVTLNFASWERARLVARAGELLAAGEGTDAPGRPDLAPYAELLAAIESGAAELERELPERVARVAAGVRRYDRLLRVLRLRDDQVAAGYPARIVVSFAARTLANLLVLAPLAAVGALLSWLPYRITGATVDARRLPEDVRATHKLFLGAVLLSLTWLAEAVAAWALAGPWPAVGLLALALPASWAALRFDERRLQLIEEARAWLLLRGRLRQELRARRAVVLKALAELVEEWRRRRAWGSTGASL
jgi:1-acyl-sn-glycerol-3-phosphate acyltransferase